MNKLELIQALKDATDLTKPEAAAVVDIFFNGMADALAEGDRVEIRGLCSFFVKEYKSYTGRNPKTGEKVKIKPKKLPFFKPGKELKDRVDKVTESTQSTVKLADDTLKWIWQDLEQGKVFAERRISELKTCLPTLETLLNDLRR